MNLAANLANYLKIATQHQLDRLGEIASNLPDEDREMFSKKLLDAIDETKLMDMLITYRK
ncbi:hypothetical protein D5018_19630 [Parashewanella curva]|uniref:Uncharacterized protein n=1 Tax=Parashewanella curva TaxID=2338552 RepID=A0A3L8PTS2_9GAMM|nr:hypothetical protein [Parashewanella curva]RLV57993.1 hypothetical protein D5018_19630 [Parashewanella curva]